MNRCEHNQPITKFCISDNCHWREPAGCDACLKKYHNHTSAQSPITLLDLDQICAKLSGEGNCKPRSKALQEAIANYFIILKSQLTNSIDLVAKVLGGRISFPVLQAEGHLGVFRKIRNKDFRKINKKDLQKIWQFSTAVTSQEIIEKEAKLYRQQVAHLITYIRDINQSFSSYAKAVEHIDKSLTFEKSFYNKILDICTAIQNEQQVTPHTPPQQKQQNVTSTIPNTTHTNNTSLSPSPTIAPTINITPPPAPVPAPVPAPGTAQKSKKVQRMRDRKVSIDSTMGLDLNRFATVVNQNFAENEKEISERKKKLFDMLKAPSLDIPTRKGTDILHESDMKRDISQAKSLEKFICKMEMDGANMVKGEKEEKTIDGIKETGSQEMHDKDENQDHKVFRLFDDLISKGLNLPQMIMHTILPRQASKQKLYQDTKQVKQRKITIPVKKFEERQEKQSPLMKIKRQKKKQSLSQSHNVDKDPNQIILIGKHSHSPLLSHQNSIIEASQQAENHSPVKQQHGQHDALLLKDRQADSIALLVQSLRLPIDKAIPLLQASLKYAYNNLSAAQYLSYLYLQANKPRECLALCNSILQQLQDSPQQCQLSTHISNNKAASLNLLGRYSQSIPILQKCISHTQRDIYYKNLGDSYFSIGIYEKACVHYQAAVRLNPCFQEAYYNLAVCFWQLGGLCQAKFCVQRAGELAELAHGKTGRESYRMLSYQIQKKLGEFKEGEQ